MLANSEDFWEKTPDEVSDSPSSDASAPSTNADISELPTITETSELSRNVNSTETLPTTEMSASKAPTKELQKHEKAKSHTEEDLKVFSSNEISVYKSDTAAMPNVADGTKSQESSYRRKQPSNTKVPNQLAVSSDAMGVTNSAFEPEETSQTRDDVQIHVTSPKTSVAQCREVKSEWNVFKGRALVGLLGGFIVWAAIFFPLLLTGII